MQPHSSKAWRSIKYLASVFTAVLCHAGAIQVDPISTRRLAIDVHETRTANRLSRFPLNRHEHQRLAALLLEQRFVRPSFEILGCPHGVGNPAKDIVNGVLRHFPKRFPVLAVDRFQSDGSSLKRHGFDMHHTFTHRPLIEILDALSSIMIRWDASSGSWLR